MKKKILKISIIGKTNAGKSTLINNLVDEPVSIVNKKINTTEDLIEGIINIKNHQLIFYDTPGFNFSKDINKKNLKLKRNLWEGLNKSDLILYLIDSKNYNLSEVKKYINKLLEINKNILIIFNKNDLVEKNSILPKIKEIDKLFKIKSFFSISAKKNLGIKKLKKYLLENTYFAKWIYNDNEVSNKDEIFITNECTRNSILSLVHEEIPYNIKVINDTFKKINKSEIKIKQNIVIFNSRYKKIIIGKNGNKIREIRLRSQKSISKILACKVHLYVKLILQNAKEI